MAPDMISGYDLEPARGDRREHATNFKGIVRADEAPPQGDGLVPSNTAENR
jgi:hypothetical protein